MSGSELAPHRYTANEHQTWAQLFSGLDEARKNWIHPLFAEGVARLQMDSERVPELSEINSRLERLTGYQGVLVTGHEDPKSFFPMLAQRKFPIGNFIRDARDLGYTPAPDIFHDLYGHLPFLADARYADFSAQFGATASKFVHDPNKLREFERLYWFTFEFGVMTTPQGLRIYGGGLASSRRESEYALSGRPLILPFDVELMRSREFRIDVFQDVLFQADSWEQFYSCLSTR